MDRTPAFRTTLIDADCHAGFSMELPGVSIETAMGEKELTVGCIELRMAFDEGMADPGRPSQDAAPRYEIFDHLFHEIEAACLLIQRDRLIDPPSDTGGVMIPVVLANPRQGVHNIDAMLLQEIRRADT